MTRYDSGEKGEKIIVYVDEDLEDLVPGFLQNRHGDVDAMNCALTDGDFETVRVLGHSMKGSGGGYGFYGITDIGMSLEEAAKEENAEAIGKWIAELSDYLDRVEVTYD